MPSLACPLLLRAGRATRCGKMRVHAVAPQDPDFYGLKMALINILESAWINVTSSGPGAYTNFGSDTGGYRSGDRTAEVLIRWAQVNAFLPLFENGGNDEHRPWGFDTPPSTFYTDIYRRLVAAHYELGPYLLTTGTNAYAAGVSAITPTSSPPADFPFIVEPDMLSDYSFRLGSDYFVVPIVDSNVSTVSVTLPGTPAQSWYEFWSPNVTHTGGSTIDYDAPITISAVFGLTASLTPLHISTPLALAPNSDDSWAGSLTLHLHTPAFDAEAAPARVSMWKEAGIEASYACRAAAAACTFTISATERPVILLVRNIATLDGTGPGAVTLIETVDQAAPAPLQRVAAPPRQPAHFTPLALSWEAVSPATAHPVAGLMERLAAATATGERTWSYHTGSVEAGSPEPAFSGLSELIVRLPALPQGGVVRVEGVTTAV